MSEKKLMEVQGYGFNLRLEYGMRLCTECKKKKCALHIVSWRENGRYPASIVPTCMSCANKRVRELFECITAAQDEDAYILAANL